MTIRITKTAFTVLLVLAMSSSAFASSSEVINSFAFNTARILGQDGGSYFFSPYSIVSAFGMAYAGASGDTAAEIEQSLGFTPELHGELAELTRSLQDGQYISSANRVWMRTGLNLSREYQDKLLMYYGSRAKALDIKRKPEASRKEINDWVSKKTGGRITNLLPSLDPSTQMIITNAVYFKANWQHKFSKSLTAPEKFRDGGKVTEVPMMKKNEDLQYAEIDGVKIVRLPYEGRRMSMFVVLPPEARPDALDGLNAETFRQWVGSMRKYDVDLWLPKFRTEESYQLADVFKALGVTRAFSDTADFSGITEDTALKVDAVIHKTFIDVDEEKTEAAAATGIAMVGATMMPDPTPKAEFHADHPFTYFIADTYTGTILFMGRQTF